MRRSYDVAEEFTIHAIQITWHICCEALYIKMLLNSKVNSSATSGITEIGKSSTDQASLSATPRHVAFPAMPGREAHGGLSRRKNAGDSRLDVTRSRTQSPAVCGLIMTTHVKCYRAIAGIGNCRQLVPPRVAGFREPMAEDHQRTFALLDAKDINSVSLNGSMRNLVHKVTE
jgi:hypothetical protein